jgi:hypothetical protein
LAAPRRDLFAAAVAAGQAWCRRTSDNPAPSVAINIDPTSATVAQGGSVVVTATLTGSGGFAGAGAAFALTGAPAGVTFGVSNLQTRGSVTTATVTHAAATVPRAYALDLRGGGVSKCGPFAMTVTVAEICFALSVNPTTLTLVPEDAANATITINRTNSLPEVWRCLAQLGGVFWMLFDPDTTGNSSMVTAGTGGPPGDYTLTITVRRRMHPQTMRSL